MNTFKSSIKKFIAYLGFTQTGFTRYFFNTSWLYFGSIIRGIVSFVTTILLVRYLGPYQFGLLNYALSLSLLFSILVSLGLKEIIIRDLVAKPEKAGIILGTSLGLMLLGSIIMLACVFLSFRFVSNDSLTEIIIIIIALGICFDSFNIIEYYFQSQVKAKFIAFAQLFQVFAISTLMIFFIVIRAPLLWFAILISAEHLLKALAYLFFYFNERPPLLKWKFNFHTATILFKQAFLLILCDGAILIYQRIDQVMIKEMLNVTVVGYYATAVRVCELWYFIPMLAVQSLYPAIINAKAIGPDFFVNRLQKFYDLMIALSLVIAVPLTIFSKETIQILFGNEYLGSLNVLKIYIWANVFTFLGVANGRWFILNNLQKIYFYRVLSGAIANVVLNLMLIPRLGIEGAAIATVISYAIATYFSMMFFPSCKENFIISTRSLNIFRLIKKARRILTNYKSIFDLNSETLPSKES